MRDLSTGGSRRRLRWAIAGSVLASEAAVAYATLALLLHFAGQPGSPAAFAAPALYGASFAARQLLAWAGVRGRALVGVAALLGAIAALLAVKIALYGGYDLGDRAWVDALWQEVTRILTSFPFGLALLFAAGFIWRRGWLLAGHPAAFRAAAVSFQLSAVLLLAVYGLAAILATPVPHAMLPTVAFFSSGLLALALAHWQVVAGRQPGRRESQWLWLLVSSVVLALAVGALVAFLFDADMLQRLLAPILWAAGVLRSIISYLLHLLPLGQQVQPPPEAAQLAMPSGGAAEPTLRLELPEEISNAIRICWGIVLLTLVLMAAYSLLIDVMLRLFRRAATPGNATVETLSGAWLGDLRALVRALLRALEDCQWRIYRWRQRHRRPPAPSPLVGAVREAYRSLLYWAAKRGLPRASTETPYEYLHRLQASLLARPADRGGSGPETLAADLATLTDSYVRARYWPEQLGADEQRAAEATWRRLKRSLRR